MNWDGGGELGGGEEKSDIWNINAPSPPFFPSHEFLLRDMISSNQVSSTIAIGERM